MSSTDPVLTAAREIYAFSARDLRASVEGMGPEGLNWRPNAPDTNTPAVLASHALGAFRDWTCIALGVERPPRSRAEEFLSHFESEETAMLFVDRMISDTTRILEEASAPDWAEICREAGPEEPVQTRAFALIHAVEHLREHVGHLQLTRQLWDARG